MVVQSFNRTNMQFSVVESMCKTLFWEGQNDSSHALTQCCYCYNIEVLFLQTLQLLSSFQSKLEGTGEATSLNLLDEDSEGEVKDDDDDISW